MERAGEAGDEVEGAGDVGDVVARAQAGDEGAWRALVDRHLGLVHAICRGHGLHDDAAAEVDQLVWLQLVEHLPRIRTPDAIGGWIAATARSLCLAPERSSRRSGYVAGAVGTGLPPPGNGNGHGHAAAEDARLAGAFARIGARCQRLLRLAATRPRPSAEDISAALDLAVAEVEPACLGCLERLRRLAATAAETPDVLAGLQRTMAGDAVPDAWRAAARTAYAWHTLDAVPARRVYDSTVVLGRGHAGAARGPVPPTASMPPGAQTVRRLRFATRDEGIELVVDRNGDEVLLTGRLASGRATEVTARWPGGERTARTDDAGAFRLLDVPLAPLSLGIAGDHPLKTGWILP